jgi:hypothetical protein
MRTWGIAWGVVVGVLAACGSDDSSKPDQTTGALVEDLDMKDTDFGCIKDWDKVRSYRVTNKLGHQAEALAAANSPGTKAFPVGTVLQLVPVEAMVKRRAGFNAGTGDWEFFLLDVTGTKTTITQRGPRDVIGPGGNCNDCHAKAGSKWDYTCEQDHGCDAIPVTDAMLQTLQDADPRCLAP